MKKSIVALAVAALPSLAFAQNTCPLSQQTQVAGKLVTAAHPQADIVDTAVAAGSFNTLVAAVKAAGLVDTLKGAGPFTVFAPTDEAFAKVPKEVVADLLKPENKAKLQAILTYHVVPGKVTADQVTKMKGAVSVQGQQIDISTKDGGVMVDNAKVVKTDIMTSNGVIHVIDSVILPADKDIVDTAAGAKGFGTLIAAVKAAGLVETLKGAGPFTVFAPTDEAFSKLPAGTVENLLKPENKDQLIKVLTYHVLPSKVLSSAAANVKSAKTVNGQGLDIKADSNGVMVGKAKVVSADLEASNGVIHVIDSVLLPQ
jgi:uncharacterized surface protein with fasciclin (FAS1) repeats